MSEIRFSRLVQHLWEQNLMDNELEKDSLRLSFLTVAEDLALREILLHEAACRGLHQEHAASVQLSGAVRRQLEQRAVAELSKLTAKETISYFSDEVSEELEARRDEFRLPPVATWRHVYVRYASHPTNVEARKIVEKVQDAIAKGQDFGIIVVEFSDEPDASTDQFFGPMEYRDKVHPAMAQALDSLESGEVSELIETDFGFFILKLVERDDDRLWGDEEKRRLRVTLDLREEQRKEKLESELVRLRSEYPPVSGNKQNYTTNTLYLRVDAEEIMVGEVQALMASYDVGFAELALRDPWNEMIYKPLERQFLLLTGLAHSESLAEGEYSQIRKNIREELIAKQMLDLLVLELIKEPSVKQLTAEYRKRAEEFRGILVDVDIIQIPDIIMAGLTASRNNYRAKLLANTLASRWEDVGGSAEAFSAQAFEVVEGIEIASFRGYPRHRLMDKFPDSVAQLEPNSFSVLKFPMSWAIIRTGEIREGLASYESVVGDLRAENIAQQRRLAMTKVREALIAKYNLELLIDKDRFYWDDKENNLGLLPAVKR